MKSRSPEWLRFKEENKLKRAQFVESLTAEDKGMLASSWLNTYVLKKSSTSGRNFDHEINMCLSDSRVGLEMIELIWSRSSAEHHPSYLGVLVEDFLAVHGNLVIDYIEKMAESEPKFRGVLHYVYRNTMPISVYKRVRACAGGKNA